MRPVSPSARVSADVIASDFEVAKLVAIHVVRVVDAPRLAGPTTRAETTRNARADSRTTGFGSCSAVSITSHDSSGRANGVQRLLARSTDGVGPLVIVEHVGGQRGQHLLRFLCPVQQAEGLGSQ